MLKTILIVLLIISFGLFVLNQTLVYYYNAEFLMQPCDLCTELNPQLKECFDEPRLISTTTGEEFNYWDNTNTSIS